MNVLVTGGAGYVGGVCAEELIRARHRVVILDDLSAGHRRAVPGGAAFVEGDVADELKVSTIIRRRKIEAVMHFAGATVVEKSMTDPKYYFENNVVKGLALLKVVLGCGVNYLVFSSSAAVYGEPISTPISEDHPLKPINSYGESKLIFEKILYWYWRAYGLKSIALRYFNAAGASPALGEDHRPETHLIPCLLSAALSGTESFALYGDDYPTPDGTCLRDFVHVRDIAQAHILALRSLPKVGFGIYNVGLGHGYSVREVADAVRALAGREMRIEIKARRPGDPAVLVASPKKLQEELKWKPRYSDLRSIVRSAWDWRQEHPQGYQTASGKSK